MAEPYCLAMILCDSVHKDSTTGKQTILGTFSTVNSQVFPAKLSFAVYYAVTDADADQELIFRVVDSRHGFEEGVEPVCEMTFPVKSPSPLAVIEGRIIFRDSSSKNREFITVSCLWETTY